MIAELLTWDFRFILQDYLAWAIGIAAILWGGGPERAVAITWLLLFQVAADVFNFFVGDTYFAAKVDVFFASVDVVAAAFWIMIALYANRNYTLWIAAMQVLAVSAHLASGIAEPISPVGYAVMVIAPGWIQLLLLAIGLTRHRLRERRYGAYRDWRITKHDSGIDLFGGYRGASAALPGKKQSSWRDGLK